MGPPTRMTFSTRPCRDFFLQDALTDFDRMKNDRFGDVDHLGSTQFAFEFDLVSAAVGELAGFHVTRRCAKVNLGYFRRALQLGKRLSPLLVAAREVLQVEFSSRGTSTCSTTAQSMSEPPRKLSPPWLTT